MNGKVTMERTGWRGGWGLVLALLTLALVLGCGSHGPSSTAGPGGGNPTGPGGGITIEESTREAAIAAAEALFAQLVNQFTDADLWSDEVRAQMMQEMAEHLEADPAFASYPVRIDVATQCVLANFADGVPLTVIFNRFGDELPIPANPAPPIAFDRATDGLAQGNDALTVRNLGTAFPEGDELEIAQNLFNAGYEVLRVAGTVDQLEMFGTRSVVYWEAHGGPVQFVEADGSFSDQTGYGLWTADAYSPSSPNHARFVALSRDERKLGLMMGIDNQDASGNKLQTTRWGITDKFVQDHFAFQSESLFFNDCCLGGTPAAAPFRAAIFAKGADLYAGWTEKTTNGDQARFFFDRALGANVFRPESPPNRPFGWVDVKTRMRELNLDRAPVKPCTVLQEFYSSIYEINCTEAFLELFQNPSASDHVLMLTPSIKYMEVVADAGGGYAEDLLLHGDFGRDPRGVAGADPKVEVGTTPLTIQSWTPTEIRCDLPNEGAGVAGKVKVTVHNRASNERPLTLWTGTMTYTHIPNLSSLQVDIILEVRFRADVGPYRERPDGALTYPAPQFRSIPDLGTARALGSGIHVLPDATTQYGGDAELPVPQRPVLEALLTVDPFRHTERQVNFSSAFVAGELRPNAGSVQLCPYLEGPYTVIQTTPQGTFESEFRVALPGGHAPFDALFDGRRGVVGCLELNLPDDLTIPAGIRRTSIGSLEYELRWQNLVPQFAPEADTAA